MKNSVVTTLTTKTMNTALWPIQSICAVIFALTGLLKIIIHKDKLMKMGIAGLDDYSNRSVFYIAIIEV